MKKVLLLLLAVSMIAITSCSGGDAKNDELKNPDQTPETLEGTSEIDIKSISKRYDSDIIDDLFKEAVIKDVDLKRLTDQIADLNSKRNDELEACLKYIANNNKYWANTENYIKQLSDSALRKGIQEVFTNLQANYSEQIKPHNMAIEKLNQKEDMLGDYVILMKLAVTQQMILNYQKNELPKVETINNLIREYDTLINDTKAHTNQ